MNDMLQSEPAGQEQMAPVQQERRLGPPHDAPVSAAIVRHGYKHGVCTLQFWQPAVY